MSEENPLSELLKAKQEKKAYCKKRMIASLSSPSEKLVKNHGVLNRSQ